MDIIVASKGPARLYALQLKLRPLQRGTLMPFSGELVHGAWLNWIRHYAPDVATWLHDGNRRRPFTCSSLRFPIAPSRMLDAERNNVHLPLDPEQTYTIRLTLLQGELFPLFYDLIMRFHDGGLTGQHQPFLQLGKQSFLLEEVVLNGDDKAGWTGFVALSDLVESVRQKRGSVLNTFTLDFASLTTFNRSNTIDGQHENRYARLPLPHYLFPGLVKRWQEIAPAELVNLVQKEQIESYIEQEGVFIEDYELKTHHVHFVTHLQKGFIGSCTYRLSADHENATGTDSLSVRQQIHLLARLAFYTGVGYKSTMGMGQARCR